MNKWLVYGLALAGLAFYIAVYFVFRWLDFDAVQSVLLTLATAVAITGLAFEVMRRAEDA